MKWSRYFLLQNLYHSVIGRDSHVTGFTLLCLGYWEFPIPIFFWRWKCQILHLSGDRHNLSLVSGVFNVNNIVALCVWIRVWFPINYNKTHILNTPLFAWFQNVFSINVFPVNHNKTHILNTPLIAWLQNVFSINIFPVNHNKTHILNTIQNVFSINVFMSIRSTRCYDIDSI
jgi:hypothetical protein